jgi:phosphoesterase RecJ-like protein
MNINDKFSKLEEIVIQNQNFLLVSHIHTDGDALGSMIAFFHYLESLDKNAAIIVPGKIPPKYHFLGTAKLVNQMTREETKKAIHAADVVVIFDISSLDRLDCWYEDIKNSPAFKICIDHHPLTKEWVDLDIVDHGRVATGELIYFYLNHTGAVITKPIAEAIYTAVLSDSGSFRFQQTTENTFRIAASLVNAGVDPVKMYSRIFETGHKKQLYAWGNLLTRVHSQGFILWLPVSLDFLNEHDISIEDIDGIIDIMRKDREAKVFIVFIEKNRNEIIVGLRSKNDLNMGKIARIFGGGGHVHAAGFTTTGSLDEVIKNTIQLIEKAIVETDTALGVVA